MRIQEYELFDINEEYIEFYYSIMYQMMESVSELIMETIEKSGISIADDLECLSDRTKMSRGKTELLEIVLRKEAIQREQIFRVAGYKHTYLIGGMAFVESILRRGVCGIKLTEVGVE